MLYFPLIMCFTICAVSCPVNLWVMSLCYTNRPMHVNPCVCDVFVQVIRSTVSSAVKYVYTWCPPIHHCTVSFDLIDNNCESFGFVIETELIYLELFAILFSIYYQIFSFYNFISNYEKWLYEGFFLIEMFLILVI